ncbi:Tripartite ATP-independent periplasmic transporters, DctQ component [Aquimixticola soesokkakensis]|uniref:TRAP transporter small permease protein n=1 Tax=Aquimixticola soesokkakensis TaxID=1519096 RepID=A0A1Y5RTY3_9RHOB|nr:TRAP transporter small permease subunit [Aquimixticola soesokkakensis]SLN24229.1 Tripartite ATP-independent periplasmic transporters, DctQ component [Aquimixticola soesokkakensis]
MKALLALIVPLSWLNDCVLRGARAIGMVAVAAMVIAILLQVFFRYVLNNALPWPDEAARFCMLWMTGLMAPTAFRRGGFVAIDTVPLMLPARPAQMLALVLLALSLAVMVIAVQIGWKEVTGLGGRFASASLYVPTSLGFDAWLRVPRSWMMASLVVGLVLLISVNIELILRSLARLLDGQVALPLIPSGDVKGAE